MYHRRQSRTLYIREGATHVFVFDPVRDAEDELLMSPDTGGVPTMRNVTRVRVFCVVGIHLKRLALAPNLLSASKHLPASYSSSRCCFCSGCTPCRTKLERQHRRDHRL